nr:helicase sen1 [Oryza sativa Japonica Group]
MCDMSFDYEKIKLSHLNQQQLYSLKSIISAVHCRSNKHIELIQGPPGSGKTEITIALLQVLHHMNLKVLLCAPKTNIVKFLTNLDKCLFPLEDALVLDNLDSTELAKEFQRLCLCHRSQDFLVGITLFKKWLREMFVLLNLDPYCTEKCDHEPTRIRCSTNSLLVFTLSSFKEKFTKLLMRKEWLTNLKERFSEIYLSADIANDITNLLSLLKDFEDLLCHERLQDKRVQWTFGLSSVPCKLGGNSAARKLNDLRLQYVDFIQRFRSSLKLPKLEERKSLEDFCIKHAKVIISTTQSTFRLHEAAMEPINLFIVDDAAKINECDLIIPLRLPVTHILMLGDDFNLQPSKVWENARFSMNPFKRLLNLGFRKHMLTEQYAIHPSIWQFPNEKFYEGRITNGATVVSPEYNKQFKGLKFPNYCFIDVTGTDGPSCKNTIELATIQYMLKIISQGLEDTEVIDVGVLCLCGSYVGGIKSSLGKKYATHNKINVHIESADSFEGETYHLVILSMLFKDENTILQIEKINAALTRARHCLWMFGEVDSVSDRGGIFAELVHDVIERKCILKWNTITTIQSKYALESDNFHGSSSASSNETIHQVCTEFTWSGRPKRTKYILAPLRDQGNSDTCTMHSCLGAMESMYKHQYACLEPPQDFSWILSTDNLKEEYENVVAKEIGSEEIEKKGKHRLATVLEILKEPGVLGSRKQQPEVVSNFKIKSHSQLPIKEDQEIKTVFDTVKDGKILVGHFHMSENFFSLRPGEIYHYDRQKPYLNPVSSLQASHAVMIIGSGVTMTKVKKRIQCAIHLSLQNSAGRLVGENGCGYVGLESIRGLYQLDI